MLTRIGRIVLKWSFLLLAVMLIIAAFNFHILKCYLPTVRTLEKPNIYLYPETTSQLTLTLKTAGMVTASVPLYRDGWHASVDPDGTIDGRFPYLFYELATDFPFTRATGWVIETTEFPDRMSCILKQIGLNDRETHDFISYWGVKLDQNVEQYAVYYLSRKEVDQAVALDLSQKPDSLLRAFFWFVPITDAVNLNPPTLEPFARRGFTVVEWGGILD